MFGNRNHQDAAKRVFEFSKYRSVRDLKQWVRRVEMAASHVKGEEIKFESLGQTAEIIVGDFEYLSMKEYRQSPISKPPCSIIQAGNGGPLNCVGRACSIALISKIKEFKSDLDKRMRIEIKVDWNEGENGRYVEDGHIVAYMVEKGGDKDYLAEPGNYGTTEDHSIEILPAAYTIQNAIAQEVEGDQEDAKKLARKGIQDAMKNAERESPYLEYLANKILNS